MPPTVSQMHFDSSKSGVIRFFGKMAEVDIHYAPVGLAMPKMVCPQSVSSRVRCKACLAPSPIRSEPRMVACGWDVLARGWCYLLATHTVFKKAMLTLQGMN